MRGRIAVLGVLLLVGPLMAGCLGGDEAASPVDAQGPGGPRPPGCDGNRTLVAHRAGGGAVMSGEGPVAVPCLSRTGFTSFEPTIGVDAEGRVFVYPATDAVATSPVGVARSDNEGGNWTHRIPAVAGVPTHPTTQDPYLYLDPVTGRIFAEDLVVPPFNCGSLSFSDDAGETWMDTLAGCLEFDHVTIFAGPPVSSPTLGYPNVVYRCAINLVALAGASTASTCQKSLDGGMTWLPPGEPAYLADPRYGGALGVPGYCDGALGHGVVDSEGVVYVPKGYCGLPFVAISRDEGLTWDQVQVSDLGMGTSGGSWGHEAGVGVDAAGNAYYLWVAEDRLPYLAVSRDGGASWGEPMMVGAPGVIESSLPALVVGGVGKVALAYIGSTNSPGGPWGRDTLGDCLGDPVGCLAGSSGSDYGNVTWNGYLGVSYDALGEDPLFRSASVNDGEDPLMRGPCGQLRCGAQYDFIDVRIGPDGTPWASYVDACTAACIGDEDAGNDDDQGAAGRLWGGPSLWDGDDPNGPYP